MSGVKTVKIEGFPFSEFEGVLLVDPDGVDLEDFHQAHDALSAAQFLTSLAFVEGMYSPVLDVSPREGRLAERHVGAEAIIGFLQDQGRL